MESASCGPSLAKLTRLTPHVSLTRPFSPYAGFAIGAFFSLMGSSFTIEDPFQRQQYEGMKTSQKAKVIFGDMGKGMWRQGKGFGMVGALYAGTECIIEGVSPESVLLSRCVSSETDRAVAFVPKRTPARDAVPSEE